MSKLRRGAPKASAPRNTGTFVPAQGFLGRIENGIDDIRRNNDGIFAKVRLMSNAFAAKGAKFSKDQVVTVHISDKGRCAKIEEIVFAADRLDQNTAPGMVMEFEGGVVKGDQIEARFMRTYGHEMEIPNTNGELDRVILDDQKVSLGFTGDSNQSYFIYHNESAIALNGDDSLPKLSGAQMKEVLSNAAETEPDDLMKEHLTALAAQAENYDSAATGLAQLQLAAEAARCQELLDCQVAGAQFGLLIRAYPLEPFLEEDSEELKAFEAMNEAEQAAWKKAQAVKDTWSIHLSKASVKVEIDEQGNTDYAQANFQEMVENEFNIAIQSHVRRTSGNKEYEIDDTLRVTYDMLENPEFDIDAHLSQIEGFVTENDGEKTYGNRNLNQLVAVLEHLREEKVDADPGLVFEVMAVRHNATVGKSFSSRDNKEVIDLMRPTRTYIDREGNEKTSDPAWNIIHDVILHEQRFFDKKKLAFADVAFVSKIRLKDKGFDVEKKTGFAGGKFHLIGDLVSNVSDALGLKAEQERIATARGKSYNPYELRKKNGTDQENDNGPEADEEKSPDGMTPS